MISVSVSLTTVLNFVESVRWRDGFYTELCPLIRCVALGESSSLSGLPSS